MPRIFRPGDPMKLRRGRVAQMVRQCQEQDSYIPCHEHMSYTDGFEDDEEPTVVMADSPVCRGFYDRYPGVGQLIRIMARLGNLHEV